MHTHPNAQLEDSEQKDATEPGLPPSVLINVDASLSEHSDIHTGEIDQTISTFTKFKNQKNILL